jgi:hypothetical protein
MPSKRVVQQLRKESYKEASNLRSEMLPEPQIIDPDHTNKRMNPDLAQTDSLVLLSDGAPPSPHSPTGFIPTIQPFPKMLKRLIPVGKSKND